VTVIGDAGTVSPNNIFTVGLPSYPSGFHRPRRSQA